MTSGLKFLLTKIKKSWDIFPNPNNAFYFIIRNILQGVKNTERYLGIRCLSTNLILKGDRFIKKIRIKNESKTWT